MELEKNNDEVLGVLHVYKECTHKGAVVAAMTEKTGCRLDEADNNGGERRADWKEDKGP